MFSSKSLLCFAITFCFSGVPLLSYTADAESARQPEEAIVVRSENAPPAEAFRVLPAPSAEGPEITPYLLYQTALAWHQDSLRQARWSQVKSEADLMQLRAELRSSVLGMIGGLPSEKGDLHATITSRVSANDFHIEKLV